MKTTFHPRHAVMHFLFLIVLCSSTIQSQEYSFGLKAGINYSLNDNGSEVFGSEGRFSAESDMGYLGGVFLEIEFDRFFVRPEIFYDHVQGEFAFPETPSVYTIDKLSIPLLLGYNVYGPVDVYAGPAYQYILDRTIENSSTSLTSEHNNLASQIGVKIDFNRFELDLRYDFTFPSDDSENINFPNVVNNAFFDDGRLNHLMLSLSYKIFGSDIEPARRGGNCYF